MADVKYTQLTETLAPAETDILPAVVDPAGTPANRKVTVKNLLNRRTLLSIVPAGNFTLGTGTAVQSAFPTTADVFTLEGSSTYLFEGLYIITKSGAATTVGMAFALSGLTITSMEYVAISNNVAANTAGTTHSSAYVNQVSATVISASAATNLYIQFRGIIRTNVAGTLTPQIIFSAAPTTPVMVADSYIRFTRVGTSTENTVGSVA